VYRAVDSTGATIDFLLSAKRDAAAAERFLAKALGGENHPHPRVINTNGHAAYEDRDPRSASSVGLLYYTFGLSSRFCWSYAIFCDYILLSSIS
jgi:transposase-like protein